MLHPLIIRARDLAMVGYQRSRSLNPNEPHGDTLVRCEGYINNNMNNQIAHAILQAGRVYDPDLRFTAKGKRVK